MTTFPYVPDSSTGDWAVYLPGNASIGEVIVNITGIPEPTSLVFEYVGHYEDWTVPAGVDTIDVDAIAASGSLYYSTLHAGRGGQVIATGIPVTPGEVLRIFVGGESHGGGVGSFPGGGHGGGGAAGLDGGGYTAVLRDPYVFASDVLVVAGAGGGPNANITNGGDGGYPAGGTVAGGTGGTQTAGGYSGGTQGLGGNGYPTDEDGNAGAGGGGGWWGGGGGPGPGASGGGGSSHESGTAASVTYNNGVNIGHGQLTLSWTA